MTDDNDFIRVIDEGEPTPAPQPTWKVAVIDDEREVTWAELADAARRVAGLLHAHGVGPGDR